MSDKLKDAEEWLRAAALDPSLLTAKSTGEKLLEAADALAKIDAEYRFKAFQWASACTLDCTVETVHERIESLRLRETALQDLVCAQDEFEKQAGAKNAEPLVRLAHAFTHARLSLAGSAK